MRLFLSLIFLLSFSLAFSQSIMPASAKAAMQVIQKDLGANGNIPSEKVVNFYPIYNMKGHFYIALLCKVSGSFNKQQALADGLDIGAVIGHIASVRLPLTQFTPSFTYPGIVYMEVAEKIEPVLNGAVGDVRADSVHMGYGLPQAYTGKNVLVGIADWGFEYAHPTFYDTNLTHYRVRAAWDQVKVIGTPPVGFSHGAVYLDSVSLLTAEKDTFSIVSDMHGTHVAGIAGGGGAGTAYRGVGFESDLLFSQMRQDASSSLDAFQWMYEMAQAEGKPLVINNSWGGYRTNPLDGTSLISQAIEAYIDSGVVFVFSAANNGSVNFHLKKNFNNDSVKTRVNGFSYVSDTLLWGQAITMWGDPGNSFKTQLRLTTSTGVLLAQSPLFNTATAPPYVDTFLVTGSDTIWYHLTTEAAHPLNNRPNMTLDVKCLSSTVRVILYSEADTGTVHYWNTRLTIYGNGNWGYAFSSIGSGYVNGDKNYGVGHPGTTTGVITVAAHMTNAGIASFSSYGPRMDEVLKPDISAPGNLIASALNSFAAGSYTPVGSVVFNSKTYDFVRLSGTSMSAPMVTGVISLLLEANPNLSPQQVKDIIINTAREDAYTGTIPLTGSNRWGWGKINAYAAVGQVMTINVEERDHSGPDWKIYPNPAENYLWVEGIISGENHYTFYSVDGKDIMSGELSESGISVWRLETGMYLLKITDGEVEKVFSVIISK